MAHGLCCRQQEADRRAHARQKLSRLWCVHAHSGGGRCRDQWPSGHRREEPATLQETPRCIGRKLWPCRLGYSAVAGRSEEHTSELQSLMRISYAVFCLKKKTYASNTTIRSPNHSLSQLLTN